MRTKHFSRYGRKLSLAAFLLVLLISGQRAQAENGVIWEKNFMPYKLLNAVFSPDDKYIYATCTDIYYVIKYDLEGNILDTIKNVGGIRKFSDDGKYFWNYNGDKYDATTFERLSQLFDENNQPDYWKDDDYWRININSDKDIAVATTWHGKVTSTQYTQVFDSNLIVFKPSESKIIKITSHNPNTYRYLASSLHPNGKEVAYVVASLKQGEDRYFDYVGVEVWNLETDEKVGSFQLEIPKLWNEVLLRYSPDGSVLGYQHDGKLTLYSTTDYSVLWESGEIYAWNFAFSPDMKFLYISKAEEGLDILDINKNKIVFHLNLPSYSLFINFNKSNTSCLCSWGNPMLILLDNTVTSITDPFFTTEYKTTLKQNPTKGNYQLQIDALQPNILTYYISDINGNIIQPNITQNLEQGTNQIDLETTIFPSGTYFINIEIASHTTTIKFMLVR